MNFSTAQIVEYNVFRNLKRKQRSFVNFLQTILLAAAHRAYVLGYLRKRPGRDIITFNIADITKDDDQRVASAWRDLAAGAVDLSTALMNLHSPVLRREVFSIIARQIGLEITDELLDRMEKDYDNYERAQRQREQATGGAGGDGRQPNGGTGDYPRPANRRDRDGNAPARPDRGERR